MMGLIGKGGMTQLFDEKGDIIPATRTGPRTVTEVRSPERDGYSAVQPVSGTNKVSHTRPLLGQYKKAQPPAVPHLRSSCISGLQRQVPDHQG